MVSKGGEEAGGPQTGSRVCGLCLVLSCWEVENLGSHLVVLRAPYAEPRIELSWLRGPAPSFCPSPQGAAFPVEEPGGSLQCARLRPPYLCRNKASSASSNDLICRLRSTLMLLALAWL